MAFFILLLSLMCALGSSSFIAVPLPFNSPPHYPAQSYNTPAKYPSGNSVYTAPVSQTGGESYYPSKNTYNTQSNGYSNQYAPQQQQYPTLAPFFKPLSFWNIFPKFNFFNPVTYPPYEPNYLTPYPKPYGYPQPIQQVQTGYANQASYQIAKPQYGYAASTYAPATYAAPKYAQASYAAPTYAPASYAVPAYAPASYAAPAYAPASYAAPTYAPASYAASTYAPATYAAPTYAPATYAATPAPATYTYATTMAPYTYESQSTYSTLSKPAYEMPVYNQQPVARRSSDHSYTTNPPMHQVPTYNTGYVARDMQSGYESKTMSPVQYLPTTATPLVETTLKVGSNYTQ